MFKMLKINGVRVPTPSTLSTGIMDISKAERNAKGTMIIERIATKRKLEMTWYHLEADELSSLLTQISQTSFNVEYVDPQLNRKRTGRFYVGDRKMGMYSYCKGSPIWTDIGFNFIEL